jgi:Zn-dependent protease
MFRSWSLGRAFGIPLYVHPTFLFIVPWVLFQSRGQGLFAGLFAVAVVLTVFGCVLLHELGHALMARYFGIRTRDITLYPIGGVARLDRLSEKPHEELCIALAGPAVNVVIAALLTPLWAFALFAGSMPDAAEPFALASSPSALLGGFIFWLWYANIGLVIFNMIPAFPMDGGRVLRAVLASWLGIVRATDIAGRIGLVMALLLAVLAVVTSNPMLVLVSLFVAFVGQQERLMVRYQEAQRRAAAGTVEPAVVEPAVVDPRGYSGLTWDAHYRVWVRWVDGRPVAYYSPAE